MVINPTFKNSGKGPRKDFHIECRVGGKSGTVLGTTQVTIYDTVKAGQTRTFREVNMGFIHGQASGASCELVSAG